jgi:hypothetical protein
MSVKKVQGNTIRRIIDIINHAARAADAGEHAAQILGLAEVDDVYSFYHRFVADEEPLDELEDAHLNHYLAVRAHLEPVLMATFQIIAAGEVEVQYELVDEGDDIEIGEENGTVTVVLRQLGPDE